MLMLPVCSIWETEAECGAETVRSRLEMVGDLGEMLCGGGVPGSCTVCVTTLWTNPRSFSCTENKYVRVLRFSAYSCCTLFPKKSEAVYTSVLGENVMIHSHYIFSIERKFALRRRKRLSFLAIFY